MVYCLCLSMHACVCGTPRNLGVGFRRDKVDKKKMALMNIDDGSEGM